MKINENEILKLSTKEQKLQSAKFISLLRFPRQNAKPRDPEKGLILKRYEDKRDGFKIGEI